MALDDGPNGSVPSGVAAEACLIAAAAGHETRAIGRIGQDRPGDTLIAALRSAEVETAAIQRDPDLPTAERRLAADGRCSNRIDTLPAAPDGLQWDHDLEDAARWADVVVFGLASWRSGQARSEELRFLDEAAGAVRALDLCARTPSEDPHATTPRASLELAVERASLACVDRAALAAVRMREVGDSPDELVAAAADLSRTHRMPLLVADADADADADGRTVLVVDARDQETLARRVLVPTLAARPHAAPRRIALVHAALALLGDATARDIVDAIERAAVDDGRTTT
jgi:sugar/nucleoside kinase (ribokinase family)